MAPAKGTIVITKTPDLSTNYHGVLIARNADTATTLKGILKKAPASFQHDTVSIDLSRLASVREGAKTINARVADGSLPPIRALVISAGFQELTTQTFTPDGYDMTFQVNYLSQFLLMLLLLQSLDKENGRIVIVSGWNHDTEDDRNDAQPLYKEEKYKTLFHDTESLAKGTWCSTAEDPSSFSGQRRYGAAHLLEVMFMRELQKRLNADPALSNISVLGVDPGAMPTGICRRDAFFVRVIIMGFIFPMLNPILVYFQPNGFLRTPAKSAGDVLRAAFNTKDLGDHPKDVYLNGSLPWPVSKEARDDAKLATLWKDSLVYANVVEGDTALVQWS